MRNATTLQKGFTLVELLVVVVLIAVLSGGVFMLMRASNTKEGIARTTASVQALATLLESYHSQYGTFPRVTTPSSTSGYYPANFKFKIHDGGSCRYCSNKTSEDVTAFGLASHFVPRATLMYDSTANEPTQRSYYEDCFEDPTIAKTDSSGNNAWELEYGTQATGTSLTDIAAQESADPRLLKVNADWKRFVKEGVIYEGRTQCPYCGTVNYTAGVNSDAWGNTLLYSNEGGIGIVVSMGPDGTLGTADDIRSDGGRTSTDDDDE